jgi:hypothetical protein
MVTGLIVESGVARVVAVKGHAEGLDLKLRAIPGAAVGCPAPYLYAERVKGV